MLKVQVKHVFIFLRKKMEIVGLLTPLLTLTILVSVKVLSVRISIIMHYLLTVDTIKTKERNSKELKKKKVYYLNV